MADEFIRNEIPVANGNVAPVYPGRETQKLSAGKRIGYFFLAIAPVAACIVLQVIIGLVVVIVALAAVMVRNPQVLTDFDQTMKLYMEVAVEWMPLGIVLAHAVGSIIFWIWYYFSFRKPRPRFGKSCQKMGWKGPLVAIGCGVALAFFANGTAVVEMYIMPSAVEDFEQMAELSGLGVNIWVGIAAVVLAPIGEELVCRGLCLKFAQKSFGKFWIANIFQAAMFGLLHMNWVQGIYAFGIGIVLGWLVQRYNTILVAMLLHLVVNLSNSTWIPTLLAPIPETLGIGILVTVLPWAAIVALMLWDGKKKTV